MGRQERPPPRHPEEDDRGRRLCPGRAPARDGVRARRASAFTRRAARFLRRGRREAHAWRDRGRSRRRFSRRGCRARGAGDQGVRTPQEIRAVEGKRIAAARGGRPVRAPADAGKIGGLGGERKILRDRRGDGQNAQRGRYAAVPGARLDRPLVRGGAVAQQQAHGVDAQPGRVSAARRSRQGTRDRSGERPLHPRRRCGLLRPQRRRRRGARRGARRARDGRPPGQAAMDARRRVPVGAVRLGDGDEARRRPRCPGERRQMDARRVEPSAQQPSRRGGRRESPRGLAPGEAVQGAGAGGPAAADRGRRAQLDPALRFPEPESGQALPAGDAAADLGVAHARRLRQRVCARIVHRRACIGGARRSGRVPPAAPEGPACTRRDRSSGATRRLAAGREGGRRARARLCVRQVQESRLLRRGSRRRDGGSIERQGARRARGGGGRRRADRQPGRRHEPDRGRHHPVHGLDADGIGALRPHARQDALLGGLPDHPLRGRSASRGRAPRPSGGSLSRRGRRLAGPGRRGDRQCRRQGHRQAPARAALHSGAGEAGAGVTRLEEMTMPARRFLLVVTACLAFAAGLDPFPAAAEPTVALTGRVTSVDDGMMEGVVVSAKKSGSTVTISVVSDANGRFSFPAAKLGSGDYALRIRATGYELDGPVSVDVVLAVTREIDLKLRKVADITPQMTNAEWIASFPRTPEHKKFLYGCVGCHTLERIAKSKHDAAAFLQVMKRMATYANNSHVERPQLRLVARDPMRDFGPDSDKQAAYLATLNQSSGAWSYALKTLPRVKGKSTRVVVTEYDLPRRPLMPHDVIVDRDGIVWYSQFDQQFLGRFDPRTLHYAEFAIPVQRPDYPKGTLDLEVDPEGNLWLSHMFQSGIVKFDKKTEKFQACPLPAGVVNENSQQSMVGPQRWTVDNKVWLNDAGIPGLHRLDMATGKFETWKPYASMKGPHSVYGIYADSKSNIFFMDFGGENVGRIEAKTGKLTLFPTPTPRSRPRRGRMDGEDRVWFAEWRAERIGMFDTKTEKFPSGPFPRRTWRLTTSCSTRRA